MGDAGIGGKRCNRISRHSNRNRNSPDGEIIETLPYVLIPLDLMSEAEIKRVRRIRQMNYPD